MEAAKVSRSLSCMVVKWMHINHSKWHFKRTVVTEMLSTKEKTDTSLLLAPVISSWCSPKLPGKRTYPAPSCHIFRIMIHPACIQKARYWAQYDSETLKSELLFESSVLAKTHAEHLVTAKPNIDLAHMFVCEMRDHRY